MVVPSWAAEMMSVIVTRFSFSHSNLLFLYLYRIQKFLAPTEDSILLCVFPLSFLKLLLYLIVNDMFFRPFWHFCSPFAPLQMPIREACHVAVQRNHPSKHKLWKHAQARQDSGVQGPVLQIVCIIFWEVSLCKAHFKETFFFFLAYQCICTILYVYQFPYDEKVGYFLFFTSHIVIALL